MNQDQNLRTLQTNLYLVLKKNLYDGNYIVFLSININKIDIDHSRTSDFTWTGKALGGLAHTVCREGLADEGKIPDADLNTRYHDNYGCDLT